jgi:transcriptional regulator with PAS, ATPase and Fis domain
METWFKELKAAVTVVDKDGKILDMNDKSQEVFQKYGGGQLIGKSVYDCHSPASRQKLAALIADRATNCYTIEKEGVKKLVYQTPWYRDGELGGLVELSLELPPEMPHFVRK